jgi:hypothetical protein
MNMAQKGFKITSNPLAVKDSSRPVVAKATPQSEGHTTLQQGTRTDNPRHDSRPLEAVKHGSGQYMPGDRVFNASGPARETISHAYKPERPHAHMGTSNSKRAHSFPGRRV